ncbi:beta-phosphoglucomutase family hydrolase [Aeromicrobium camelliae]|uniref:Beta-phosphoglucomutase n=1 Tax=Aeromicrobium camelliae TaxID=1538144 RepID=A0A3N6X4I9_9ACTN|nr:beta-phosphoglucomutase family hydrolase [Aeromicrobium camelliae]RQN09035.1 beta-phosphoglucomutase family hydrolase [Aeromicrobium camelliae]
MNWSDFDAALFDLDGVITPTAVVHMHAWDRMFNDFLAGYDDQSPYTDDDYFRYVDGKPRYEGVQSFLASRGIELPFGDPSDAPSATTVCGLGNRKNDAFEKVLATEGVEVYPGSKLLVEQLAERGLKLAVVSSSRNARKVLDAAGMLDFFPVIVDGNVAEAEELAGKPQPDTFLDAAKKLGVSKDRAVVLEDAVSGVQAGRSGAFGLVVGVDRGAGREALLENGADVVVQDLEELA